MPVLPTACFLGLSQEERREQLYLALGGTDNGCFLGLPLMDQYRTMLELIGSEACIFTPEDFWREWLLFLDPDACVGMPLEGLQQAVYALLYAQEPPVPPDPPIDPPVEGLIFWGDAASVQSSHADGDEVPEWEDSRGNGNTILSGELAVPIWDATAQRVMIYASPESGEEGNGYFILPESITATTADFSLFVIGEKLSLRRAGAAGSLRSVGYLLAAAVVGAANVIHRVENDLRASGNVGEEGSTKLVSSTSLIGYTSQGEGNLNLIVNGENEAIPEPIYTDGGTPVSYGGAFLFGIPEVAGYGPFQMAVKHVLIYDHKLTEEEMAVLTAFSEQEGVNFSPTKNLVIESDSIGVGVAALPFRGWSRRLELDDSWRIANTSEPGITALELGTQGAVYADERLDVSASVNLLIFGAGVNDLATQTGATTYARIKSYCEDRRAAGWEKIVIVGLPDSFVSNTERQALRTAMLSDFGVASGSPLIFTASGGTTWGDVYVDMGGDAQIGLDGTHNNTTFFVDGLHPTEAGHVVYVGHVNAGIQVALSM